MQKIISLLIPPRLTYIHLKNNIIKRPMLKIMFIVTRFLVDINFFKCSF